MLGNFPTWDGCFEGGGGQKRNDHWPFCMMKMAKDIVPKSEVACPHAMALCFGATTY